MKYIKKLKMFNYKKFIQSEIIFNSDMNLLIGDNEAGKSSILQAIDLILSGSRNKVETIGLDRLINMSVIENFMNGDRNFTRLPKLIIELFLNDQMNPFVNGTNNSEGLECDGLRLICEPSLD